MADRTGEPLVIEYRHVRKDGTVIWVHEEAVTIERDHQGRPTLAQGVMYDVTERKHAEQDLAQTEARYRTLVERVPAVTYTWDAAHRSGEAPAPYISPQVQELLGYSADEFGDPQLWATLVHADDLERVLTEWAACEDGDATFRSEYRMRTRDGREVWIRDEAIPVGRDDQGHALFQGVMFDITERKLAEERLQKAEANYRTLVEQLPVVVYQDAVDDVSTALYISPQYERLFGFPPGHACGTRSSGSTTCTRRTATGSSSSPSGRTRPASPSRPSTGSSVATVASCGCATRRSCSTTRTASR